MPEAKDFFDRLGHVYLFAKNSHDAREFARDYGLQPNQYTVIDSTHKLRGIRDIIVIRISGWDYNRQAMEFARALDSRRAVYVSQSEIEQALDEADGAL